MTSTMTFGSLFAGIGGFVQSWHWRYNAVMPRGSRPKEYPPSMVEEVRQLYSAGHTQGEIALIVGTTQKVVWRLMQRHGIKARVAAKRNQTGESNHSWKGQDASYQAKHIRVINQRGQPLKCEICGTTEPERSYDWACVNGDYDDIGGYIRMCRSCHWKHDGTVKNLNSTKGGIPC